MLIKYNKVKKVEYDGIKFDSKKELAIYKILKEREANGLITDLALQTKFSLIPKYENANMDKIRAMEYRADFYFFDVVQNRFRVIDAKGWRTEQYKLKKKLFDFMYCTKGLFIEEKL